MVWVDIDRDSVAAGDDVVPHAREWEFSDEATVADLVQRVAHEFLPSVHGRVAWTVELFCAAGWHDPSVAWTPFVLLQPPFQREAGQVIPLVRSRPPEQTLLADLAVEGRLPCRVRYHSRIEPWR